MLSLSGLYKAEYPALRETCESLLGNLKAQSVRTEILKQTIVRAKWASLGLGGAGLTMGSVWAYLKFGGALQPHVPVNTSSTPGTVPVPEPKDSKTPTVAMPGAPTGVPKPGPTLPADKPVTKIPTVVDKAGSTTEGISKR